MAEQTFLPAIEEAAERQREQESAALRAFIASWELEDMPACPAGMVLLHDFAIAHPAAYELARKRGFVDPPLLGNNARWQSFSTHRNNCPDCNESGQGYRAYNPH